MTHALNRSIGGRRSSALVICVVAFCCVLSACGGGGSGGSGNTGGIGSGATSLSCDGYPKNVMVTVSGMPETFTQVCLIIQRNAPVTPTLSVSTNFGNLAGHGANNLSSYVVNARIIAQAADEATATTLAKSVVISTANSSVSAMPDQVAAPQALEIDFEVFTAPTTNLILTSNAGNMAVDNYNATLQLTPQAGNVSLQTVQGQVTVNDLSGNVSATLAGSGWTGTGMTVTTDAGNIAVLRPAGYEAAFTATADAGNAAIDSNSATTAGPPAPPAVVSAGSGAPIKLESKSGNISVTATQ